MNIPLDRNVWRNFHQKAIENFELNLNFHHSLQSVRVKIYNIHLKYDQKKEWKLKFLIWFDSVKTKRYKTVLTVLEERVSIGNSEYENVCFFSSDEIDSLDRSSNIQLVLWEHVWAFARDRTEIERASEGEKNEKVTLHIHVRSICQLNFIKFNHSKWSNRYWRW